MSKIHATSPESCAKAREVPYPAISVPTPQLLLHPALSPSLLAVHAGTQLVGRARLKVGGADVGWRLRIPKRARNTMRSLEIAHHFRTSRIGTRVLARAIFAIFERQQTADPGAVRAAW